MKKLGEKDYQKIMDFTKENPYANLFIVGDLMIDGFNDDIQQFFGRYENEALVNVAMQYWDGSLHLYAHQLNEEDYKTLRSIIETEKIKRFNFGEKTAPLLKDWLIKRNWEIKKTNLAVYHPELLSDKKTFGPTNMKVEKATPNDTEAIQKVLNSVFEASYESVESLEKAIREEKRLVYVIRENEQIVSIASAVAFTNDAAMIIGVGTLGSVREKGYASLCVQKLCDDLYETGRNAVLFYDNPKAGSIYHKIGFVDLETYFMGEIKNDN